MNEVPFIVGGRVEPPYFVGREKELTKLISDAQTLSQNNLILAPRRFGKTCLLHNVKIKAEEKRNLIIPEINCAEMTNCSDFYQLSIQAILKSYQEKFKIKGLLSIFMLIFTQKTISALRSIEKIGGSIAEVGEIYLKFREKEIDEKELLRACFDFMDRFTKEKNINLVLIYDEFQETNRFDSYLFKLLKSRMDFMERVRFFFSGSSMSLLDKVFLKPDSPLYMMVARHFMSSLDKEIVSQFVIERFTSCNLSINKSCADLFFELTGGIPFYIQKLGLMSYQNALLKGEVKIENQDVHISFKSMIEELDSEFEARFSSRFSELQRRILKTLSFTKFQRMKQIADALDKEAANISTSLQRMVESMILGKTDNSYYISDEVFRRWLLSKF